MANASIVVELSPQDRRLIKLLAKRPVFEYAALAQSIRETNPAPSDDMAPIDWQQATVAQVLALALDRMADSE